MLINADASQLEWRVVVHLSDDKVGKEEILNGVKFHKENQIRFGLPAGDGGYLAAKVFLFRAIYKGSAYAYATDPDFSYIGNEAFWQRTIDKFYEKYEGIYNYHNRIIKTVVDTGVLEMPTGRVYQFEQRFSRGEYKYSENDICNYPVQGLAADIMALIRVEFRKRAQALQIPHLLINTVHDSIVLDMPTKGWYNICKELDSVFKDTQRLYQETFFQPLLVPMACEVKIGVDWKRMHTLNLS